MLGADAPATRSQAPGHNARPSDELGQSDWPGEPDLPPWEFPDAPPEGCQGRRTRSGTPSPAAPREEQFKDEDFDEIQSCDGNWVVKGLFPRGGVCIIGGPSMSFKTFLTLYIMSNVALGLPVWGRRSELSGVVYVASEGASGMRARIEALRGRTGGWAGRMRLITQAPNLRDPEDIGDLQARLGEIQKDLLDRTGVRLGAVVVDTLSASIPGADENSSQDMSLVLRALQDLATSLDVCVVVIAHVGKDAERGIRGWSGLVANADGVIIVNASDQDGTRVAKIVKVKDGEAGEKYAFGLEPVVLRKDADGDDVTSCVVEWRNLPAEAPKSRAKPKIKPEANTILVALRRLEDSGVTRPVSAAGAPPGTRGVPLRMLQEAAFDDGLGGAEPDDPDSQKRWWDARRKLFANNLGYLVRDGFLRSELKTVWRLHPEQ